MKTVKKLTLFLINFIKLLYYIIYYKSNIHTKNIIFTVKNLNFFNIINSHNY